MSRADLPTRTAYLVKQLELAMRARLDAAVRPYGLTTIQYTALAELRRHPGLSSAQLARRSFVSAQTMQELVARLELQGLVRRKPSGRNKRVLQASLTAEGQRILAESDGEVDEIERDMLADLDPDQVTALRHALRLCTRRLLKD
ncbi:MarR family winged helix-turn-helix transcriptional regulator [Amycolatopsis alkalitolerans]|uniref:MarR family transcriptional regulator n=1 Tax=Amycolatopsis alkalitolerans TaxID=2547244 RepID=A0A5C4LRY2_9PSEU|nr:MarR family transcriptional regulator [Amycolatopsis alkalitolerans]TNC20462.1 MarR family transcriptional regulator [Amycolatopsis alkalitolerans]